MEDSPRQTSVKTKKHALQFLCAAGLLAAVLGLFYLTGILSALDRSVFDYLTRKSADPSRLPDDVVMVLIDENTVKTVAEKYGVRWPWPREFYAALFSGLYVSGAQGIAVDLMFNEPSEDSRDLLLSSYCAAIPNLVLARHTKTKPIVFREEVISESFNLEKSSALVDFAPDVDGVIRRYSVSDSFAEKLSHKKENHHGDRLKWYGGVNKIIEVRPELVQSASQYIDVGMGILKKIEQSGVDVFDPHSLSKSLGETSSRFNAKPLNGKTVFLGVNFAAGYDVKAVSVGKFEPGLLAHYTAYVNAQRHEFIHQYFDLSTLLIAIILALVLLSLGWYLTRFYYITGCFLALLFALITGTVYLFYQKLFFVELSTPTVGLVLAFVIVTSRNWLVEFQQRRQMREMFGSYVSLSVMERLLANPEALKLGGEKRELTAYFSDLAGFTDMSEKMSPEELVEVINLYLKEMTDFVIDNGGYLDKYIGDAIMGVFGAPQLDPDHAYSACKTALQSRERLKKLSDELKEKYGVQLHARIGINTGPMVVGNVGSDRKKNYTVLGDAVNLASRLEGAGKEFGTTILIGPATHAAVKGRFITRPIELLRVKGKLEPVMVHELVAWTLSDNKELEKFINNYTKGYELYRKRDFSAAHDCFSLARQIRPSDKMAQVYESRAEEFMKNPPPADWDGVFVMKTK